MLVSTHYLAASSIFAPLSRSTNVPRLRETSCGWAVTTQTRSSPLNHDEYILFLQAHYPNAYDASNRPLRACLLTSLSKPSLPKCTCTWGGYFLRLVGEPRAKNQAEECENLCWATGLLDFSSLICEPTPLLLARRQLAVSSILSRFYSSQCLPLLDD